MTGRFERMNRITRQDMKLFPIRFPLGVFRVVRLVLVWFPASTGRVLLLRATLAFWIGRLPAGERSGHGDSTFDNNDFEPLWIGKSAFC